VSGGRIDLSHIRKLNADVYLTILRQLDSPGLSFSSTEIGGLRLTSELRTNYVNVDYVYADMMFTRPPSSGKSVAAIMPNTI